MAPPTRGWSLSALIALPLLAGCLGSDVAPTQSLAGDGAGALPAPEDAGLDAAFSVLSRSGVTTRIEAKAWLPHDASAVILGIHGCCGSTAHGSWDVLDTPGYSLAAHQASLGRAFVAIDLPGTGQSAGAPMAGAFDDEVLIVRQLAQALRTGDYEVEEGDPVGFSAVLAAGHSRGGDLAMMAQAHFSVFDAILMTGSSLGPTTDNATACFTTGPCARWEFEPSMAFFLETADPAVVEEVLAPFGTGARPAIPLPSAFRLGPDPWTSVTVPVLFVHGAEDWFYERASMEQDPSRVPNADADLVILERTGHFVFHHHTRDAAFEAVDAWLDEKGL